ncbi:hypothetical protein [Streptomyces chartreusis]|uniref:hypothetical protein n=1 Tax=Streptomyces chartreusis TaxID=1969 RepID=UPI00380F36CB
MATVQQPETNEGPFKFEQLAPAAEAGSRVKAKGTEIEVSPETLDSLGISYPPPPTDPSNLYVWTKTASFGNFVLNDPVGGNAAILHQMTVRARRTLRLLNIPAHVDLYFDCGIQSINRRTFSPFAIYCDFQDAEYGSVIYTWGPIPMDLRCGDAGRVFHASFRETSYLSWFPNYTWLHMAFFNVYTVKCT